MGTRLQEGINKILLKISSSLRCRVISRYDGNPYLERYYLLSSRFCRYIPGVYLHRFLSGDEDPELHSHPWGFSFSIILSGSYIEERRTSENEVEQYLYRPGNINIVRANDFHRVDLLNKEVWTLFVSGSKDYDWGFWNRHTHEYTPWKTHVRRKENVGIETAPVL